MIEKWEMVSVVSPIIIFLPMCGKFDRSVDKVIIPMTAGGLKKYLNHLFEFELLEWACPLSLLKVFAHHAVKVGDNRIEVLRNLNIIVKLELKA